MLKSIHDLVSCESVITPFGKQDIVRQSQCGPIVVLVGSPVSSGAIIITPLRAFSLKLEECKYDKMVEKPQIARLALAKCEQDHGAVGDAKQALRRLLKWLWQAITYPIVVALGLKPESDLDKLPRFQWVCCGIFSHLPIHASEDFTRPRKPFLAQYAVSSYFSSIRYTVLAKRNLPRLAPTQLQVLIVTMPRTDVGTGI